MEVLLYVTLCFSLVVFETIFKFCYFNIDMSWCGSLCVTWTCISSSFRLGNFSAIISSSTFSTSFSLLLLDPYKANVCILFAVSEVA